jgi:hypothetical protein
MIVKTGSEAKKTSLIALSLIMASSLVMLLLVPSIEGADTGPVIRSGSDLSLNADARIEEFSIWIEFPTPMDGDTADRWIRLYVPGQDERTMDDPDLPYDHNWSADGRTLTISSGDRGLGDERPYSLTVSIDTMITDKNGESIYQDDRSDVVLTFGDPNRMDLDYGIPEILIYFVLPFFILSLVIISIEIVLRLTVRSREKEKVHTSAETLLRLIDRTERMLRLKLMITLSLTFMVIAAYFIVVLVALINSMFAMVMTWAAFLFLSPWVIVVISSALYFVYRREDLAWRVRLRQLRKQQGMFLNKIGQE